MSTIKRFWLAISLTLLLSSSTAQNAKALDVDSAIDAVFQRFDISKTVTGKDIEPRKRGDRSYTYTTELEVPKGNSYLIISGL